MQRNVNQNIVFKHLWLAAPVEDNRCFPAFIDDEASESYMNNAVVVDRMNYSYISRDDLVQDLDKHIKGNVVRLSLQYYHQECGMYKFFNAASRKRSNG